MKKIIMMIILILTMLFTVAPVHANTSDLNIAKTWIINHYSMHVVEVVNYEQVGSDNNTIYIETIKTKAISKTKGKIIGTKEVIKYPKKVKRGKKYTMYIIHDEDEIVAIVCCGKIKADEDIKVNCPNCNGYDRDCPYWIYNESRHMTEEEIADFEFWEGHYIDEEGNVCEF